MFCVGDFVDFDALIYILHAHIAYHEPRTCATNNKIMLWTMLML